MRKPNKKLMNTMMLGTLAFMLMLGSFRVSAAELQVYKCTHKPSKVIFQDFACSDGQVMEVLQIRFNQSADIAPGLRPQENLMLQYAQQRQLVLSLKS